MKILLLLFFLIILFVQVFGIPSNTCFDKACNNYAISKMAQKKYVGNRYTTSLLELKYGYRLPIKLAPFRFAGYGLQDRHESSFGNGVALTNSPQSVNEDQKPLPNTPPKTSNETSFLCPGKCVK